MTQLEAQMAFLKMAKTFHAYGCDFFPCKVSRASPAVQEPQALTQALTPCAYHHHHHHHPSLQRTWKNSEESSSEGSVKSRTEAVTVCVGKSGLHLMSDVEPVRGSSHHHLNNSADTIDTPHYARAYTHAPPCTPPANKRDAAVEGDEPCL